MYISLHVKCPLFFLNFNETWIFRQIFEKSWNIKLNENPSSGNHVHGQAQRQTDRIDRDGRTDIQTRRSWYSHYAISRARLNTGLDILYVQFISSLFPLPAWVKSRYATAHLWLDTPEWHTAISRCLTKTLAVTALRDDFPWQVQWNLSTTYSI
jgi:hypothetical protein